MKRWFHLTLVCCVLLGLCLSFAQAVDMNHDLPIVGLRPEFDRGPQPASDALSVSVVTSMRFAQPRAELFRSLVLDCGLTVGNNDPPGQENHGPPEPMGPWRVAGQAGNSNQRHRATLSAKLLVFSRTTEESGFRNSL
jgi:hypothetical protein